ncbi:MAG: HDOD domain-containing protein [Candidatus Eiseniibacteriota bacterium]
MAEAPRGGLDLGRFKTAGRAVPSSGTDTPPVAPLSGVTDPFSIVARERRVKEVLANIENLPSLPTVVLKALQLTNDSTSRAADFEEVIKSDQALAARVLKLANSPFFGLRSKVTSISQAVVVLGIKTLKSVVIAAKTSKLLNRQLTPYGFDQAGMWKHSITCAMVSHLIARKAKFPPDAAEELFVAGLLHDVGKTLLAPHITKFPDEFAARLDEAKDIVRTESELVGISHDEVGGRMAGKWGLDPRLEFLIRNHHRLDVTGPDGRALYALQVANDLCNQLGVGRVAGGREASPSFAAWIERLGFRNAPDLVSEVEERLVELQPVFESIGG